MKYTRPKRLPEANIQAQLYMRLYQEKIPCTLEYKVPGSRFDVVVHDHERIKCIIEIKSMTLKSREKRLRGERIYRQIVRYESHGVPVVQCLGEIDIENSIQAAKEHYHG